MSQEDRTKLISDISYTIQRLAEEAAQHEVAMANRDPDDSMAGIGHSSAMQEYQDELTEKMEQLFSCKCPHCGKSHS